MHHHPSPFHEQAAQQVQQLEDGQDRTPLTQRLQHKYDSNICNAYTLYRVLHKQQIQSSDTEHQYGQHVKTTSIQK